MEPDQNRSCSTIITFEALDESTDNFSFYISLSEPCQRYEWGGHTGFIHQVVYEHYLMNHPNVQNIDFYLCGPPPMIAACQQMLKDLNVSESNIAFDEF